MKKIIFFDIDGTLFNVSSFINLFNQNLISSFGLKDKDIDQLKSLYDEVKKENGYFLPSSFLDKISDRFSFIDKKTLKENFYNVDLFDKSMYKDTSIVNFLADSAIIGIFSKGEVDFQKRKIVFINNVLDKNKIYIFPNKIDEIREVFEKFEEFEVYLVDDDLDVLREVKKLTKVNPVLIDRNNHYNNTDIKTIRSLNELKSILYE